MLFFDRKIKQTRLIEKHTKHLSDRLHSSPYDFAVHCEQSEQWADESTASGHSYRFTVNYRVTTSMKSVNKVGEPV